MNKKKHMKMNEKIEYKHYFIYFMGKDGIINTIECLKMIVIMDMKQEKHKILKEISNKFIYTR